MLVYQRATDITVDLGGSPSPGFEGRGILQRECRLPALASDSIFGSPRCEVVIVLPSVGSSNIAMEISL